MLENIKKKFMQIDKQAIKNYFTYHNVVGISILVIGLLLLVYTFDASLSLVIGAIYIDETWFVRLLYLIIITLIGGYLLNQGVTLIGFSRLLATIFLVTGLAFLLIILITAEVFIETYYQLTLFIILGIAFFGVMVAIFLYITSKGVSFFLKTKMPEQPVITSPHSLQLDPVKTTDEILQKTEIAKAVSLICPGCLSTISPEDTHCIHCGRPQDTASTK